MRDKLKKGNNDMNTAKRWLCAVLAGVLALGLSSCGKEEFYFQNVTASDYVTLGQYTGLTVSSEELDEYWASTADSILQANSTQEEVDRADMIILCVSIQIENQEILSFLMMERRRMA